MTWLLFFQWHFGILNFFTALSNDNHHKTGAAKTCNNEILITFWLHSLYLVWHQRVSFQRIQHLVTIAHMPWCYHYSSNYAVSIQKVVYVTYSSSVHGIIQLPPLWFCSQRDLSFRCWCCSRWIVLAGLMFLIKFPFICIPMAKPILLPFNLLTLDFNQSFRRFRIMLILIVTCLTKIWHLPPKRILLPPIVYSCNTHKSMQIFEINQDWVFLQNATQGFMGRSNNTWTKMKQVCVEDSCTSVSPGMYGESFVECTHVEN